MVEVCPSVNLLFLFSEIKMLYAILNSTIKHTIIKSGNATKPPSSNFLIGFLPESPTNVFCFEFHFGRDRNSDYWQCAFSIQNPWEFTPPKIDL